jgi:hypothetical protein
MLKEIDKEKVGGKLVYIAPDEWYTEGLGLSI